MVVKLMRVDITSLDVDAIVNAANSSLMGGGGVDGAIHSAGGPAILGECKKIRASQGELPTGEAVITTAGNLPSRHVIHTVGPVWKGGDSGEDELLRNCYINSLKLAEKQNLRTIAFPNISTGIYGYPKERAAEIAVKAVNRYNSDMIKEVTFVCFDDENYQLYQRLLNKEK